MATILQRIFEHNLWANLQILDACERLTESQLEASLPGHYGDIKTTLVHILCSEPGYLAALTGEPRVSELSPEADLPGAAFPGFGALKTSARASGEGFITAVGKLSDDEIITGERRGEPFSMPASVFVTQAINHATEHRAEIKAIMTQEGVEPPEIDAWDYRDFLAR